MKDNGDSARDEQQERTTACEQPVAEQQKVSTSHAAKEAAPVKDGCSERSQQQEEHTKEESSLRKGRGMCVKDKGQEEDTKKPQQTG